MSFTGYQAQCLLARLTLTVIQFKGNISNPTMASAISVRAQALLQFLGGCSRRSHQYVKLGRARGFLRCWVWSA